MYPPTHRRRFSTIRFLTPKGVRRARRATAILAALPLFQTTGCYPDLLGAINFELQNLLNTVLIDLVATVVQNLLRL